MIGLRGQWLTSCTLGGGWLQVECHRSILAFVLFNIVISYLQEELDDTLATLAMFVGDIKHQMTSQMTSN